jgi:hypothetical protein
LLYKESRLTMVPVARKKNTAETTNAVLMARFVSIPPPGNAALLKPRAVIRAAAGSSARAVTENAGTPAKGHGLRVETSVAGAAQRAAATASSAFAATAMLRSVVSNVEAFRLPAVTPTPSTAAAMTVPLKGAAANTHCGIDAL